MVSDRGCVDDGGGLLSGEYNPTESGSEQSRKYGQRPSSPYKHEGPTHALPLPPVGPLCRHLQSISAFGRHPEDLPAACVRRHQPHAPMPQHHHHRYHLRQVRAAKTSGGRRGGPRPLSALSATLTHPAQGRLPLPSGSRLQDSTAGGKQVPT